MRPLPRNLIENAALLLGALTFAAVLALGDGDEPDVTDPNEPDLPASTP